MKKYLKGKNKFAEELPLPHEPDTKVSEICINDCKVFSSTVAPIRVVFKGRKYPKQWREGHKKPDELEIKAMVKNGDDMR